MLLTIQLFPNGRVFFLNWANSWKEYCPDCISTESQKMQMLVQYKKNKICTKEHNADD